MTQIGTGWLVQQRNNDAAFGQLIGRMSLEEVRPYMCPKSHGNPKKCDECDGFRTCQAGQRALRLMKEQEEQKEQEQPMPRQVPVNTEKDRGEFRKACESGNPWGYLMREFGMSEATAQEKLNFWVSHYVDITKEFGGRKRVLSKPKAVTITRIGGDMPEDAQDGQKQASEAVDEQTVTMSDEAARKMREGQKHGSEVQREKARKVAAEAIASGDPIRFLVENCGISQNAARQRVYKWVKNYPDITGDYQLPDFRKEKRPVKAPDEPEEFALVDDSEVTLEEFLKGFDEVEEFPENLPEPETPEEMPVMQTGNPVADALRAKMDELKAEKAKLEEKLRWIEKQQDALEKTLSLFP